MEIKIKQIMSKVFNIDINLIKDDITRKDFPQWDSMNHLNLVVDIEQEFNITLNPEKIISIIDYKSLVDIVKSSI